MQVIFLSPWLNVVVCFVLWGVLQVCAAVLCAKLPARYFKCDNFIFKSRDWEQQGEFYSRVFKIKMWKGYLPDGSALSNVGMRKKHLVDCSPGGIDRFIEESCRAELSHLLAVFPFWVFGFFCPPIVVPIMLLYSVLVNIPCVLAQRYNRPRLVRLRARL